MSDTNGKLPGTPAGSRYRGGMLLDRDRRPGFSMTTQQAVANVAVLAQELRKIPRNVRTADQEEMITTFETITEMWAIYQSELMGGLSYRARPGS